jgi:hypothetical protein
VAAAADPGAAVDQLTPRTVHAYLTAILAAEAGRSLVFERETPGSIALVAAR